MTFRCPLRLNAAGTLKEKMKLVSMNMKRYILSRRKYIDASAMSDLGIEIIWNKYCLDPGNDEEEILELLLWYQRWGFCSTTMLYELAVDAERRVEGATFIEFSDPDARDHFEKACPTPQMAKEVWKKILTKILNT